jgi:hypothetical protein
MSHYYLQGFGSLPQVCWGPIWGRLFGGCSQRYTNEASLFGLVSQNRLSTSLHLPFAYLANKRRKVAIRPDNSSYGPDTIPFMSDFDEARKKAESGSVVTQGYVGWCYLYGRETDLDYSEALRWLSAAAYEGRASRPFVHLGDLAAPPR